MTIPLSIKALLSDYPVYAYRQVNWGDMDAARHVNNTIYLRWAEVGRSAYLDESIPSWMKEKNTTVGPVLAKLTCKYIFPVRYPDTVWIGTRPIERMEDRIIFENLMVSEAHERVVAKIEAAMGMFDFVKNQKVLVSDEFWEAISQPMKGIRDQ